MRAFIKFITTGIILSVIGTLALLLFMKFTSFMNAVEGNYDFFYLPIIIAFSCLLAYNILAKFFGMIDLILIKIFGTRTHKSSVNY